MTRREAAGVLLVFAAGVAIRLALASGFGLGDDPGYWHCYHDIYASGVWSPDRAYDLRFAFSLPVAWTMQLFGDGEAAFIGFVTFCSFLNLLIVYGLARQEWDHRSGLLAMGLLAVLPLDVLCSTLFVIDIPMATYCFAALLSYRAACAAPPGAGRIVRALAASALLFLGYSAKQWAVLVGLLFVAEALRDWRRTCTATVTCGGGFVVIVAAYFGWEWWRFGDPLHDVSTVRKVAIFEPHSWVNQLDYARMLFLPNEYGSRFAGFVPHLALALPLVVCWWRPAVLRWPLYFLVLFVALTSTPSVYEDGTWKILVPHIFRYLALLAIPMCLALAASLREIVRWSPLPGGVLVAALLVVCVVQSVEVTAPSREAFAEGRAVVAVLEQFPDDTLWLDSDLHARFLATSARAVAGASRVRVLRGETPAAKAKSYAAIDEGILVTGGARLPWYGCFRCIPTLDDFAIPPTWRLLAEWKGGRSQYRPEDLRVWRISARAAEVDALLRQHPDWPSRAAALRALMGEGRMPLAAAFGERMLAATPPPELDAFRVDVARACLKAARPHCARAALGRNAMLSGDRARLALLVDVARATGNRAEARAAARLLRDQFPGVPLEPVMLDVAAGLDAGVAAYQKNELREAVDTLRDIWRDPAATEGMRRRAGHHLALTLFRQREVAAAMRVVADYEAAYGRDDVWAELQFRHGEALERIDPAGAAAAFELVVREAPSSSWAPLAKQRIGSGRR